MTQTITSAKRDGRSFGLIVMDLDGFKDVNDSLGHDAGDDLLQTVASNLTGMLRETDTVARLGGDEFAILFPELDSFEAIEQLVQKIAAGVMSPLEVGNHRIDIGVSIGIARYPEDGDQQERLLRNAEIAMYVAKRNDKSYMAYQSGLNQNKLEMLLLKSDLREAISGDQLSLYYQPQINMADKRCIGVEALARWIHPERGFVPPDEFIQVAERAGLIRDLSRWVINEAISQAARWHGDGWPICVAINLSARNLQEPDLLEFVTDRLNAHGVPPSSIQFELTESDIMSDPETAIAMIESLTRIGIEFSVDDFGTGYSSLAYLKQLNISELKIDRSFISQLTSDGDDMVIVHSTITMAHKLGIRVVAEGVEHQAVWDLLEVLDCDLIQGYFISRPLPVAELALLREAGITDHIG
ncbi:MAG: bifunctional diguanylate cyclase/phosphodiesterase [Immundisolibacteraceae bacterium]|nr:bifunctional diguanylate cyclase/phosphodiesterase [Immundisolibacteraceae bacterium]